MKVIQSVRAIKRIGVTVGLLGTMILSTSHAREVATVVSSTPILEQINSPVTVCENKQVSVQGQKSGGGALIGAIAGGAVGDAIGEGSGRALATAIGVIGGAVLGDRIEGEPAPTTKTVQDCHQEYRTTTRTKGYRVIYEYAGKRYEIEMANDPGPTLPVQVTPLTSPSSSIAVPVVPALAASGGVSRVRIRPAGQVILAYHSTTYRTPYPGIYNARPGALERRHWKREENRFEGYAWR